MSRTKPSRYQIRFRARTGNDNQQVRVSDMAYGFIEHSGEHYGQLAVYYRVAGLVPPESRPKK